MPARILIVNGNTAEGNAKIVSLGGEPYGKNYTQALQFFEPDLDITVLNAADGESLPSGVTLDDFDGIAWTGSLLSAYWEQIEVTRQIELAKAVHASRIPCFGSCWGQQIMCHALGGEVRANPKGLEIGLARDITLIPAGKGHPMFEGKSNPFDALAIHRDEVVSLPSGAVMLAGNAMSDIQAMELSGAAGNFWGVQYHPEFDLKHIAILYRRDEAALIEQGICHSPDEVAGIVRDFETLHADTYNQALIEKYDASPEVLDPALRMAELGNWLRHKVMS